MQRPDGPDTTPPTLRCAGVEGMDQVASIAEPQRSEDGAMGIDVTFSDDPYSEAREHAEPDDVARAEPVGR